MTYGGGLPCYGKSRMPAPVARKVAKRMRRTKDEASLQAYRCSMCGNWHVGSSPKKWYPK